MIQHPTIRRSILAACLLAAFAAHAEEFDFSLPAQDLAVSLDSLSSQSHVRLMYSPEAVKGLRAPALNGHMAPEQAIAKLLEGSGLTWSATDGVIAVKTVRQALRACTLTGIFVMWSRSVLVKP